MPVTAGKEEVYRHNRELDAALQRLDTLAPRKACIARMRLVGRLSIGQIASCLGLSPAAVEHDWRFARVWLAESVGL